MWEGYRAKIKSSLCQNDMSTIFNRCSCARVCVDECRSQYLHSHNHYWRQRRRGLLQVHFYEIALLPLGSDHSVTRFGDISPLWHDVKNLWPFWNSLFGIWQNFELTLTSNLIWQWAIFNVENGLGNILQVIQQSCYTDCKRRIQVSLKFMLTELHVTQSADWSQFCVVTPHHSFVLAKN